MSMTISSITRSIVNLAPLAYDMQRDVDELNRQKQVPVITDEMTRCYERYLAGRREMIDKLTLLLKNLQAEENTEIYSIY